jgi:hypothetical protein
MRLSEHIMSDRSNVRQRREAARMLEFLARAGHVKQPRRPVSLEEYESLLRQADKQQRAKRRTGRRS